MKLKDFDEDYVGEIEVNKRKFFKWGMIFVGFLLVCGIIGFGFELLTIQKSRVVEPMKENVRRNVFENTQSYVHGKRQELAKAYGEWSSKKADERVAIEEVIKVTFADFPSDQINNDKLRNWLVSVRGY